MSKNIIDSLFLELGIDTTKFSADQKKALDQIAEFEKHTKKSAKGSRSAIKTVGQAFHDIASDSAIGASARKLDNFSAKLRGLGASAQVAGGAGEPLGAIASGLGALLNPATLIIAALGIAGKAAWDFNEKMTATNATIYRQSMLAGMHAKNMWAWGEAAKTVGGSAIGTREGIAGLQTAIMGGMIGAGMPTAQLTGLARLGVKWNAKTGVDIKSLFERVHAIGKKEGWARTWALVSSYGLMNESEFNLAMSKGGGAAAYEYAKTHEPPNFNAVLKNSLESQALLGKKDIMEASIAERAYGGIQNPMQTLVGLVTDLLAVTNTLLGWTIKIAQDVAGIFDAIPDWLHKHLGPSAPAPRIGGVKVNGPLPADFDARQALAMRVLMRRGMSRSAAASIVGNLAQESSMDPTITSDNGAHIGLGQWDKARQAAFAKRFGYSIGAANVPERKQFLDELLFAQMELHTSQRAALAKMQAAHTLHGKTRAFEEYDERPGPLDHSFGRRLTYAREAYEAGEPYARKDAKYLHDYSKRHGSLIKVERALEYAKAHPGMVVNASARSLLAAQAAIENGAAYSRRHGIIQHIITNHTDIGDVHVHTPATDPRAHAAAVRKELTSTPLLNPAAQNTVTLATRGMAN